VSQAHDQEALIYVQMVLKLHNVFSELGQGDTRRVLIMHALIEGHLRDRPLDTSAVSTTINLPYATTFRLLRQLEREALAFPTREQPRKVWKPTHKAFNDGALEQMLQIFRAAAREWQRTNQ